MMKKITMKVTIVLFGCLVYFVPIFHGHMPEAASTPAANAVVTAKSALVKLAWQQEWDSLLDGAKKEKKVAISTSLGAPVRQALTQGFKAKYGIDLDFVVGRAAEILPKIIAERSAGLYLTDVHLEGISGQLAFNKAGFNEQFLDSFLILPEVLDPKAWISGRGINFIGKNKYALSFLSRPTVAVVLNTELVKPGEIRSYRDLLNPKWKGKMVMQDPTVNGAGNLLVTVLLDLMGKDYLQELARQEPVIVNNKRLMTEWVARGKYAVLIAPDTSVLVTFTREGAPLKPVYPIEGVSLSAGYGCLSLMNKAPHPAGARVFINWLLTREGQTIFAKAAGTQSARTDVVHDWVNPEALAQPGGKYIVVDTEESALLREKTFKIAKEIFGYLMK